MIQITKPRVGDVLKAFLSAKAREKGKKT